MSHFETKMHQVRFLASVRLSLRLLVCVLDGVLILTVSTPNASEMIHTLTGGALKHKLTQPLTISSLLFANEQHPITFTTFSIIFSMFDRVYRSREKLITLRV